MMAHIWNSRTQEVEAEGLCVYEVSLLYVGRIYLSIYMSQKRNMSDFTYK